MVDEEIAQVDPSNGVIIGSVERNRAHLDGICHASVHIWILDRNGLVLLQHRSKHSRTFAAMWDISAAGHIRAGEDGLRELEEELGVKVGINDVEYFGYARCEHDIGLFKNREFARMYLYRSDLSLEEFSFTDGEVQGLAGVTTSQLYDLIGGVNVKAAVFREGVVSVEEIVADKLVPQIPSYWDNLKDVLGGVKKAITFEG